MEEQQALLRPIPGGTVELGKDVPVRAVEHDILRAHGAAAEVEVGPAHVRAPLFKRLAAAELLPVLVHALPHGAHAGVKAGAVPPGGLDAYFLPIAAQDGRALHFRRAHHAASAFLLSTGFFLVWLLRWYWSKPMAASSTRPLTMYCMYWFQPASCMPFSMMPST